ncbi:MAG TPA: hypothetical protein VMI30_08930 [Stellaceae bacterium]|nr:hypothetical protein [Stellaceae bacterium]
MGFYLMKQFAAALSAKSYGGEPLRFAPRFAISPFSAERNPDPAGREGHGNGGARTARTAACEHTPGESAWALEIRADRQIG